jgi:precorrin-2 dehydrogenase/sirohydrochlorin ferrochelatase
MPFNYPLMLDVQTRSVVIIGGGSVALRKVRGLLDAGATKITVVSPEFNHGLPFTIRRLAKKYEPRDLEGAALVFAATDDAAVNDAVVRDCNARGILVCRADRDDALPGDFATPAMLRQGPIAVTASADSPALSATIRDGIAARWDERWTKMAELMREIRPRILADSKLSPQQRTAAFRLFATEQALQLAEKGSVEDLLDWLSRQHP